MSEPLEPLDPLEPLEPEPPGRRPVAASPLPRLWKSAGDDPGDTGESEIKKKKRAKAQERAAKAAAVQPEPKAVKKSRAKDDSPGKPKKPKVKAGEGGSKGVLVEETPEFDTYETRQRIRIAIGAGLCGILLLVGLVIYKAFAPATETPGDDPGTEATIAAAGSAGNSQKNAEQEARTLYKQASDVAKSGKPEIAVALLKQITKSYATTETARLAQEALDRPAQKMPLFNESPIALVTAANSKPASVGKQDETKVVDATTPAVPKAAGTEAGVVMPVNPPEASTTLPANPPTAHPAVAMKSLPKRFYPMPGTVPHSSGWPIEIVGERDNAPMKLVFGDTFIQGRDDADPAEGPSHQVALGTYYIDVHEVTVRQFNVFQKEMGKRTERVKAIAKDAALAHVDDEEEQDLPAVMVNFLEAADFAAWTGKRLPTEAQWEAAARTPEGWIHPWGREPAKWSRPRAYKQIDPIRSFPLDMSPYGIYDLAGNAWEWTGDWYDPKYYQQFKTSAANNPTGPAVRPKTAQRVVKGTSKEWLASRRAGFLSTTRLPYLGFRCVLQVEGPGNAFEPAGAAGAPAGKQLGGQGGNDVPF